MPVYRMLCPDCGHEFSGMVFAGSKAPENWYCSACGGDAAQPLAGQQPQPHPLETGHPLGCTCCQAGRE